MDRPLIYYNLSIFFIILYSAVLLFIIYSLSAYMHWLLSLLFLLLFLVLLKKTLYYIEMHEDSMFLFMRGRKRIAQINYGDVEYVKLTKRNNTKLYNIELRIVLRNKSLLDRIAYFEINTNKEAEELMRFLKNKDVIIKTNLYENNFF
jgi:Ca2+/Na+ antiporter